MSNHFSYDVNNDSYHAWNKFVQLLTLFIEHDKIMNKKFNLQILLSVTRWVSNQDVDLHQRALLSVFEGEKLVFKIDVLYGFILRTPLDWRLHHQNYHCTSSNLEFRLLINLQFCHRV